MSVLNSLKTSIKLTGLLINFFFFVTLHSLCKEGDGIPLQYSCLENPMDGGAWWAAVYWVAQSQTRLKRLSSSSSKNVFMFAHEPA